MRNLMYQLINNLIQILKTNSFVIGNPFMIKSYQQLPHPELRKSNCQNDYASSYFCYKFEQWKLCHWIEICVTWCPYFFNNNNLDLSFRLLQNCSSMKCFQMGIGLLFLFMLNFDQFGHAKVSSNDDSIEVSGDLMIIALFSVHRQGLASSGCGQIQERAGLQRVEVALQEIEEINRLASLSK